MVLLTGIVRLVIAIPAVVKSLLKRLYSIATVKVQTIPRRALPFVLGLWRGL